VKRNPRIQVDGKPFTGWKSIRISRSLESPSGQIEIKVKPHEVRQTGEVLPWRVRPGAKIQVDLPGATRWGYASNGRLFTGHVDVVRATIQGSARELTVSGRCTSANVVDCSASWDPGEHRDVGLVQLAEAIAAPLGVGVALPRNIAGIFKYRDGPRTGDESWRPDAFSVDIGTIQRFGFPVIFIKKIPLVRVSPGDSAWSVIETASRIFGVLIYGNEDGELEIAAAGKVRAVESLIEGRNIVSGQADYSHADRFSEYRVVGQAPGDDDSWGEETSHIVGRAEDPSIQRYRPLTVTAESSVTPDGVQARAEWEASVRAARGSQAKIVVMGWEQGDSVQLWRINETVNIISESLGLRGRMLIVATEQTLTSGEPARTVLTLAREDAYEPKPVLDASKDPFNAAEDSWG
jgi:prophage tail gpP-like protein